MKRKLAILTSIAMIIALLPTYSLALDQNQGDATEPGQPPEVQLDDIDLSLQLDSKDQVTENEAGDINESEQPPEVQQDQSVLAKDVYQYVKIIRPSWNEVIYQGEKLWTDYYQTGSYESYDTCPAEMLFDSKDNVKYSQTYPYYPTAKDDTVRLNGTVNINSKKLTPGTYYFYVLNAPVDVDDIAGVNTIPGDWIDDYNVPVDYMPIKIKKFLAPSSLKVTAGKKKVTITYKASAGATKYKIYRSLKKGSGYKCIKTTTAKKYVDKKVKKGKRYYYKVKAVRSAAHKGTIYSGFTAAKRTKKVK